MSSPLRFLLLQVRDSDDPMRTQEVECFAEALHVDVDYIRVHDLLDSVPDGASIREADCVFIGGSGKYSAIGEEPWLLDTLQFLRELTSSVMPLFASCWGFQAMARALGGEVIRDPSRAELGTKQVALTKAGIDDPVFGPMGESFPAQMGHEDCVVQLPAEAIHLASSAMAHNQAYRIKGRPIYCTQFHPELRQRHLLQRVNAYPEYVEKIVGTTIDDFMTTVLETRQTDELLERFVRLIVEPLSRRTG